MIRSARKALVLPAVIATLAIQAPLSAQEDEPPPPQPVFPEIPADAPAGTGIMQPCMPEVEGTMRCGRYRVWEDREAQSGRTIDLGFVIADALDPNADESSALTFFFGGPGSAVTPAAPFMANIRRDLRETRDLLFLDFRGVGASQALDCAVPYPRGVASRFGSIFPIDHIEACRDHLSERTRLDLYTSATNMDDLDELREWLNYRTLDLWGGSYGTQEIQVFLRRHPESVRTAILAAVSPIFEGGYVTHARSLQNALDELVVECLADERCGAAYPELRTDLETILEAVRTDPPEVSAEDETVRFGPGELGYALRGLLYGRAREVPALVTRAAGGDWQPLVDYYLQRSGWVSEPGGEAGMHFSVICAEDISRLDLETIERETAGTFLGDYLVRGYYEVCRVWPHAELEGTHWDPVVSDKPVLLFSGNRDPVTPSHGGDAVAAHLPNSRHIVLSGAGHQFGGACLWAIQRQFVETASLEDLDTSCLGERPPTDFVLPGAEESEEEG